MGIASGRNGEYRGKDYRRSKRRAFNWGLESFVWTRGLIGCYKLRNRLDVCVLRSRGAGVVWMDYKCEISREQLKTLDSVLVVDSRDLYKRTS